MIQSAELRHFADIIALARGAQVYEPHSEEMAQTDIVVSDDAQIMAFATWQVVLDEATLLALAVTTAYRGQGIAQALLNYGEQRLWADGIRQCFLEVRASNQVAQRLYRRSGYTAIATRVDYYPTDTGREAAIVMHKQLFCG